MCRWFPSTQFIKMGFQELQRRSPQLERAVIINERTIDGVVDRVYYGEPRRETKLIERAAILLRDLIMEHPFSDGNKRVAFFVATHFLYKNYTEWNTTNEALIQFGLDVASGIRTEIQDIAKWIQDHTRSFSPF